MMSLVLGRPFGKGVCEHVATRSLSNPMCMMVTFALAISPPKPLASVDAGVPFVGFKGSSWCATTPYLPSVESGVRRGARA